MAGSADIWQALSVAGDWLGDVFALLSPFGTDSRFHWTGLSAFLVLGTVLYLLQRKRADAAKESLFGFLFPSALYTSPSSWVDVKVYFAGRLLKPLIAFITVPLTAMVMATTARLVHGLGAGSGASDVSAVMIVTASLLVVLLADFAYYVTHRLTHESEWLWPFHKLHHSAEVLTPITAKRNHPVFDFLLKFMTIAIVAPVSGIIFGLFGIFDLATIFGLNVLIALMNVTGGALRHSHMWLDFGPVLGRIFISPAQHQIHHSMAVKHHDKNYGLTLAIWDWMFGTLYVPETREALTFGVSDREGNPEPQVHNTLKEAYLVPFTESANVLRKRTLYPEEDCA